MLQLNYAEEYVPRRKQGKVPLREVRMGLNMTQQELVNAVETFTGHRISRISISDCERGYGIRELTAWRILTAINALHKARGRPELTIDDLTWIIVDRKSN